MRNRIRQKPPKIAGWLMTCVSCRGIRDRVMGDLDEIYVYVLEEKGLRRATFWYWMHVMRSLLPMLRETIVWRFFMVKNYIRVTLRNIKKHPGYFFINVLGLAVGMSCFILVFLYVTHELSYDGYHQDSHRIYRIAMDVNIESSSYLFAKTSVPLVPVVRENFPEVERAVRIVKPWWQSVVKVDETTFIEEKLLFVDDEIFQMFTIPFLHGDAGTALSRPNTIVLTKRMASKYFGNEKPMGKYLDINGFQWEVTGVVENAPTNTHLPYDFLLSFSNNKTTEWDLSNWAWGAFYAYVKLAPKISTEVFAEKIRHAADDFAGDQLGEWRGACRYFLQPVKDIHLHSNLREEMQTPGSLMAVTLFAASGILILLIACINFTNLMTAQSADRAKEVGLRKVVGACRRQLSWQFIGESQCISFIALIVSLCIVFVSLPHFNDLTGMHFTPSDMIRLNILMMFIGLTIAVGFISGSYPAFLLSHFKPATILKDPTRSDVRGRGLRQVLVIGQFVVSVFLLIATAVILSQISFMKHMPLGFNKEQKLIVPVKLNNNYESVKAEFLKHPSITGSVVSYSIPGRLTEQYTVSLVGPDDTQIQSMTFHFVDYDFIPEYGIEMVAGRAFQRDMRTDFDNAFVINEAAVKALGFDSPDKALGKYLEEGRESREGPIIGVTKDFHYKGLQSKVEPLVMQMLPNQYEMISLTFKKEDVKSILAFVEEKWHALQLGELFSYFFFNNDFNRQYGSEDRMGRFFITFAVLAVFISCLGLLGLSSFAVRKRTKEIGVRKVLGATDSSVVLMLYKDFGKWVLVANLISWPISYFAMTQWLQNFAYHGKMSVWIFLLSGLFALMTALIVVSYQSIKAARVNPVDSLRYE